MNVGLPVLRLGDVLLTGLLGDLDDKTALLLTEELSDRIAEDGARGVVVDISRLEVLDSFVARVLTELAATARLLGARVCVVGMRPAVAVTLTALGLDLAGVRTAIDLEQALAGLGWRRPDPAPAEAGRDGLR